MKKTQQLLVTIALGMGFTTMAQPGSLDPTFADNAEIKYINFLEPESEATNHILIDPQDRIWIGGYTLIDGDFKLILSRLTPDGIYDADFHEEGYVVINVGAGDFEAIQGMVWQNDKLLIAGYRTINNVPTTFVMRYTSEGVLDQTFGEFGIIVLSSNTALTDMKLDAENNIYLSGGIAGNITMAKLLPDGSPDGSFDGDGFREMNYASTDRSASIAIKDNGEIYIFGYTTLLGTTSGLIHSLNPDGSNNTDWSVTGRFNYIWPNDLNFYVSDGIISESQSCFYLAGNTASNQRNVAALAIDFEGNLRTTFGNNGRLEFDATLGDDEIVNDIIESVDGLYFAMNMEEAFGGIDASIAHFDHQGQLIATFGNEGLANYNLSEGDSDMALALAEQSNGNLILVGIVADGQPNSFSGYAARVNTEAETTDLEVIDFNLVRIYPNPATSHINITAENMAIHGELLQIYNNAGQLVYSNILVNQNQNIEISQLAPGQCQMIIGNRTFGRFTKLK